MAGIAMVLVLVAGYVVVRKIFLLMGTGTPLNPGRIIICMRILAQSADRCYQQRYGKNSCNERTEHQTITRRWQNP
jgi:hypothetical protein